MMGGWGGWGCGVGGFGGGVGGGGVWGVLGLLGGGLLEKVWFPTGGPRDLEADEAGRSSPRRSTTSPAAIPTGTSHRTGRRRGRTNSFGATVLKCRSEERRGGEEGRTRGWPH